MDTDRQTRDLVLDPELLDEAASDSQCDCRTKALALEDLLHANRYHLNGFDQSRTSTLGTYGGVLDFEVIRRVVEATPELDWQAGVTYWQYSGESTGSPTFYLLASTVERLIGKKITTGRNEDE